MRASRWLVAIVLVALGAAACGGSVAPTGDAAATERSTPAEESTPTLTPPPDESTPAPTPAPDDESTVAGTMEPCSPEPNDEVVDILPVDWAAGLTRNIESRTARTTVQAEASTASAIEIVEATDSGWSLRWTFGESLISGIAGEEARAVEQLQDELDLASLAVEYDVDVDGVFVGVTNTAELEAVFDRVFEVTIELASEGMTAEQRAQLEANASALMEGPDFVAVSAGELPRIWHSLYGRSLEVGEVQTFDQLLPNPFGGEPIAAYGRLELLTAADEDGCARVRLTSEPDSEAMALFVEGLLASQGVAPDELSDEELAMLSSMTRLDTVEMVFDVGAGWPREVVTTSVIRVGGDERRDEMVITDRGPRI